MRKLSSCVVLVLLALPTLAAPGPERERGRKEPWNWTDEERVAVRFDRVSMAERMAAYEAANPRAAAANARDPVYPGSWTYVIEGRRNPELLMPHELFDGLLDVFDPREDIRQKTRALFDPRIHALGLSELVFWDRIELAAHDYMPGHFAGKRGPNEAGSPCARRKALEMAEQLVGRENLYRVLYTVVAPGVSISGGTNDPYLGKALLKASKGCDE
jgi:hypothetical protein